MAAMAPQIVHVLYGYGKATEDPEQLPLVAKCLQIYSVGIFAWCMQPVLMRGFFSMQKTLKPVLLSTGMTVLFIILGAMATNSSPDFTMLVWVTNVCAILLAIILFFALESDVGRLDRVGVIQTILKSAAASTVAGGFAFFAIKLLQPTERLAEFASLTIIGICALWVYYFIAKHLKMPESNYFSRAFRRK